MSNVHQLPQPAPQIIYEWIDPDDVSRVWDTVLPGIQRVARYGDHWRVEDVYAALRTGASHLHVIRLDGRYAGLVVTTPTREHDGPVLHVWIAYAEPWADLNEATTAQLKEWARAMKARRVVFATPRRGWERLARRLGFRQTLITYECEVAP